MSFHIYQEMSEERARRREAYRAETIERMERERRLKETPLKNPRSKLPKAVSILVNLAGFYLLLVWLFG